MTVGIVDTFEMIDVHEKEAQRKLCARAITNMLEVMLKRSFVRDI